jgi:hypothetical protein
MEYWSVGEKVEFCRLNRYKNTQYSFTPIFHPSSYCCPSYTTGQRARCPLP